MNGTLVRVTPERIAVGERLPFDIFDPQGTPLLARGGLIASLTQATQLRPRAFRVPEPTRPIFNLIRQIAERLVAIEADIRDDKNTVNWVKRLLFLSQDFIDVADSDPDAAFACLHLDLRNPYLVVHHLMAAMVCCRLTLTRQMSRHDRLAIVAAALTHDIGLLKLQPLLSREEKLGDEAREMIRNHPRESVALLRRLGVDDPVWLDSVEHHHEYLDGSGYYGKSENELGEGARMLALADTYSAMLRPRPYRERIYAHDALETLYANETNHYDGYLLESLIWDFGFYPPGSMLRLVNRELAIAVRNTPGLLDRPQVAALTDALGRPLLAPAPRDTNQPEYAIASTLDPAMAARAGRLIEQCWAAET